MSKSLYRLPLIAMAILAASGIFSWATAKDTWDQESKRRKAEYMFLEAQSAYALNEYDRYITLIERSYALDTADIDIAGEWAMLTMMDNNADSARIERAYQLLTRRFRSNPHNYYNGALLANIALQQGRFEDALSIWLTLDSLNPTRPDVSQELAKAYLRTYIMGDSANFDKGMAIYDRIQQGAGRSIDLTAQRIQAYNIKDDTLSIIRELDSLYAFAPKDSRIAQFIGMNYDYMGMADDAIKYYDIACQLDSTNGMAYLQRARFYNNQGDSVGFDREVFHALESQNLDVDSKVGILRSYVSELYTDPAQEPRIRQLFDHLQLMHAGEPTIHDLYGAYLYERDDYAGAAEQFSYVTALLPNEESSWTSYLQAAAMAEDTTRVVNAAHEAMEKFPQNLYFPMLLSNAYRINGNDAKALEVLNAVDISEINNPRAVSNFITSKADIYTILGDTLQALKVYDEAIDIYPDNSLALNNAAYFMALLDTDLAKAEKYSSRSLQNDELNPTYLDTYAWVLFKRKDYQMAMHYIDIALNSYTADRDSDFVEGADTTAVLEDEHNFTEDEGSLTETIVDIIEVEGPSAEIYDHAGDIYFMNGERDKAVKFWEKAYALEPEDIIIKKKIDNKTIFFR